MVATLTSSHITNIHTEMYDGKILLYSSHDHNHGITPSIPYYNRYIIEKSIMDAKYFTWSNQLQYRVLDGDLAYV